MAHFKCSPIHLTSKRCVLKWSSSPFSRYIVLMIQRPSYLYTNLRVFLMLQYKRVYFIFIVLKIMRLFCWWMVRGRKFFQRKTIRHKLAIMNYWKDLWDVLYLANIRSFSRHLKLMRWRDTVYSMYLQQTFHNFTHEISSTILWFSAFK